MRQSHCFSLHGIGVEIRASGLAATQVMDRLREDFERFDAAQPTRILVELDSERSTPVPVSQRPALKINGARVYGITFPRVCVREGSTTIYSDEQGVRRISVFSVNEERLHEAAWLAVQSALGELLDLSGRHRIHGAGLRYRQGPAVVVAAKPGAGKSPLVAACLGHAHWSVYSDESPLLQSIAGGAELSAFPTRIALRPSDSDRLLPGAQTRQFSRFGHSKKRLHSLPDDRMATPQRLGWILFARPAQAFGVRPINRAEAAARLFPALVVGHGLMQMTELFVRLDSVARIPRVAGKRLSTGLSALQACRFATMTLSRDAECNRVGLEEFLERADA